MARPFELLASVLPKPLRDRYETLRRDVAMVGNTLFGSGPSPLVARDSSVGIGAFAPRHVHQRRPPDRSELLAPRALAVVDVVRETPDASSFVLTDPSGRPIDFIAG